MLKSKIVFIVIFAILFITSCDWAKKNLYPIVEPTCKGVCKIIGINDCHNYGILVPYGEITEPICTSLCDLIPDDIYGKDWKACVVERQESCEGIKNCMNHYGVSPWFLGIKDNK